MIRMTRWAHFAGQIRPISLRPSPCPLSTHTHTHTQTHISCRPCSSSWGRRCPPLWGWPLTPGHSSVWHLPLPSPPRVSHHGYVNPRFYMANLAPNHILRGSIPEVLLNIKFKFVMFITGMNIGEGTKKRDLLTCKTGMQRKATCKRFFHCLHWYYAGCSTYIHATYQLDNLLVGDSLYQTSRLSTGIMLGAVHTYVLRTNWTICCWVTASTRPADSVLVLCWVQYIHTIYVPTGQSVGGSRPLPDQQTRYWAGQCPHTHTFTHTWGERMSVTSLCNVIILAY